MTVGCVHLTDASSGATRNSGTNGDLCTLLDWALTQCSPAWAIEYTATNHRVYRPATGNRNRVFVAHDSALSGAATVATVRGCENATAATNSTTLINPFPTVTQNADTTAIWVVSSTANTTTRPFHIWVWPTGFIYASNYSSTAQTWTLQFFGDAGKTYSGDSNNTVCSVINGTTVGSGLLSTVSSIYGLPPTVATSWVYWARDISGSVLSSRGALYGTGGSTSPAQPGILTNLPAAKGGYGNLIAREKCGLICAGAAGATVGATALVKRGWFPQLWLALHSSSGGIIDSDFWQDTAYAAGSQFRAISSTNANTWFILEDSDTWTGVPLG